MMASSLHLVLRVSAAAQSPFEDFDHVRFPIYAATVRHGTPWNDFQRAGAMLNLLSQMESLAEIEETEINRIKDSLQPNQGLANVQICSVGRPDYGHSFVAKLKAAAIPIVGEPVVFPAGMMVVAAMSLGEQLVTYSIVDIETGNCPAE